MKSPGPLGGVCIALVGIVVAGALVAPPLFYLGEFAARAPEFRLLRGVRFERYLNRSVLLCALGCLFWARRFLWEKNPLLRPNRAWIGHAVGGFLIGGGGIWAMTWSLRWAGLLHATQGLTPAFILRTLCIAAGVALLEESLFRGALLGALSRSMPAWGAVAAVSLLFAALHFVHIGPQGEVGPMQWSSGLRLLPHLFASFYAPTQIAGALLTLLGIGLLLGYLVVRTHSLFLGIGLHAGWVFGSFWVEHCCRVDHPSIWMENDLRSGLAAWLLVGLTALGLRLTVGPSVSPAA
jgi:membrane protease YdiL (CAAX protease family)